MPARRASRYCSGGTKNSPITAGISLSEKAWVSRRKWTSITFSSVRKKPKPRSGQGIGSGVARAGSIRIQPRNPRAAIAPRSRVNVQTRTAVDASGPWPASDDRACRVRSAAKRPRAEAGEARKGIAALLAAAGPRNATQWYG